MRTPTKRKKRPFCRSTKTSWVRRIWVLKFRFVYVSYSCIMHIAFSLLSHYQFISHHHQTEHFVNWFVSASFFTLSRCLYQHFIRYRYSYLPSASGNAVNIFSSISMKSKSQSNSKEKKRAKQPDNDSVTFGICDQLYRQSNELVCIVSENAQSATINVEWKIQEQCKERDGRGEKKRTKKIEWLNTFFTLHAYEYIFAW